MINQQLLDFIKSQLLKGVGREVITKELLANSWTQQDINETFEFIDKNSTDIISNQSVSLDLGKNNVIKKTNRIKFYFSTLIIIGILAYILTIVLASFWMLLLIPTLYIVMILITIIIFIIYEIRHPINNIYDENKIKSIYKKFIIISSILLLFTVIVSIFYFGPIIKNYNTFKALESINYESPFGPNSPVGGKPSLESLLTDKIALLIYALLIFSSFSLFLSLKKKEATRVVFIILIPLCIPIIFITLFYGPTKYSEFVNTKVNKSSGIVTLENAREMKDISICEKITDPSISYQCISAVAQVIDINFDKCSEILVNPVDIGDCQWKAIKKMQNPTAELCKKINNYSGNKDIIDECHSIFAIKNNDFVECSLISDTPKRRFNCYTEVLKKDKNIQDCKKIDKMQVSNCTDAYVNLTGDVSVCSSYDTICHRTAAVFNKDKSLCLSDDKFCSCSVDTGDVSGNCYKNN